jgi:formylglycine-generating enzyme required for sulfatase activity
MTHPLYWRKQNHHWEEYQLRGLEPLNPNLPVSHISFYEADAYARWMGARLPTEFELETYCSKDKNLFGKETAFWDPSESVYPSPQRACDEFDTGLLWQWTNSAYSPYPGYKTTNTALGEYNGKFMANQYVLKGGCVATPKQHMRASYRNFYRPSDRWAFTGIRLAKDL